MEFKKKEIKPNFEALEDLIHEHSPPGKLLYKANENKDLLGEKKDKLESFKKEMLKKHAVIDEMTGMPKTKKNEDGELTDEIKFKSDSDRETYEEIMTDVYNDTVDIDVKTVQSSRVQEVKVNPPTVFQLRWMFE